MNIEGHIKKLTEKHRDLDKQIELMESMHSFDPSDLTHLKKMKLRIKDEIELMRKTKSSVKRIRKDINT